VEDSVCGGPGSGFYKGVAPFTAPAAMPYGAADAASNSSDGQQLWWRKLPEGGLLTVALLIEAYKSA
jgi:hypothetical protein